MSGVYIKSFSVLGGDAFLIKAGRKNIIVDLGYTNTYYESIKTEILKIKEKGEFIDLLMITHIDEDHIAGGIAFLKDCNDFEFIKEVWFNSYRHLPFKEEKVDKVSYTQKVVMKSEFQRRKSIKSECITLVWNKELHFLEY